MFQRVTIYSTGRKHLLLVVRIGQPITESIHLGKQDWKDVSGSWSSSLVSAEPFLMLLYGIFKVVRFLSPPLSSECSYPVI